MAVHLNYCRLRHQRHLHGICLTDADTMQDDRRRQRCTTVHICTDQHSGGAIHRRLHGRLGGPLILLPDEQ